MFVRAQSWDCVLATTDGKPGAPEDNGCDLLSRYSVWNIRGISALVLQNSPVNEVQLASPKGGKPREIK